MYVLFLFLIACQPNKPSSSNQNHISYCSLEMKIDGIAESQWDQFDWHPIDQLWIGSSLSKEDFQGKYKIAWNEEALYVLAHIMDDQLIDINQNPLDGYWNDDCLEIFVDGDASGGIHQYNHNAFAYHISINQDVVDIGKDSLAHFYNDNVFSKMTKIHDNNYLWEFKILMFDDSFRDLETNKNIGLSENQQIGFAIAYCDNDSSKQREHFIGSVHIEGNDKNRGWIDADILSKYSLIK